MRQNLNKTGPQGRTEVLAGVGEFVHYFCISFITFFLERRKS
jgi:hypothetical protein